MQSHRWQVDASVPEDTFETQVAEMSNLTASADPFDGGLALRP
jgi:hypothetical protein